jgi:RNA polymerase-interacting CarD/CdnL/TRCF family regulator
MSNVKHPKGKLRLMAAEAKKRVTENNYKAVQKESVMSELPLMERELYRKILDILARESELINPIGELINREAFEKMTPAERQRELFRLSELYLKIKAKLAKVKSKSE